MRSSLSPLRSLSIQCEQIFTGRAEGIERQACLDHIDGVGHVGRDIDRIAWPKLMGLATEVKAQAPTDHKCYLLVWVLMFSHFAAISKLNQHLHHCVATGNSQAVNTGPNRHPTAIRMGIHEQCPFVYQGRQAYSYHLDDTAGCLLVQ